jgi:iron complex transport system permease protein
MGSFVSRTWGDVLLTLGFLVPALVIFIYYARELNVITLGSRTAVSLGVDTARVRLILLITASLMTAVCVSVSGIIGFVGLLVPHLMRALTGPDHRLLLPAAVLVGAILLLAADTVTRALLPNEIPIGVITALLGGPVFCYVFRQRQQLIGGGR